MATRAGRRTGSGASADDGRQPDEIREKRARTRLSSARISTHRPCLGSRLRDRDGDPALDGRWQAHAGCFLLLARAFLSGGLPAESAQLRQRSLVCVRELWDSAATARR
jgi:hypothetical protein